MKKAFFCIFALFACTGLFSQERIAVFPFEDMDNVFTRTEAIMFYREFSNEFTNKSVSIFKVVPRQEVEKLINTEAAFQISDFSTQKKTAEMQRVLNGTQILSGLIGKLGNNIRITVSLYTYPELQQLPGGTTISVADTTELFNKIPELVQNMQKEIVDKLPKPPPPPPPKPTKQLLKLPDVFREGSRLWSVGLNIGTSFATPLFIGNVNITIPPFPYTFIELGADIGLAHGKAGDLEIKDVDYHSWYYYGRFNGFIPFDIDETYDGENGGVYIGLGGGFMDAYYKFPSTEATMQTPTFDFALGVFFGSKHNLCRIGYTLRTNFSSVNHRIMLGYTLRICNF